jgi:hypothetical protein
MHLADLASCLEADRLLQQLYADGPARSFHGPQPLFSGMCGFRGSVCCRRWRVRYDGPRRSMTRPRSRIRSRMASARDDGKYTCVKAPRFRTDAETLSMGQK